jgi:5-methylcytosine-specific restriction endonuclease McrA
MPFKLKAPNKLHPKTAYWYRIYTKSTRWHDIKERLFKRRGKKCEKCGNEEDIIVHHLTYECVTYERLKDLQVLCRDCHNVTPHGSFNVPYIDNIYNEDYISPARISRWVRWF